MVTPDDLADEALVTWPVLHSHFVQLGSFIAFYCEGSPDQIHPKPLVAWQGCKAQSHFLGVVFSTQQLRVAKSIPDEAIPSVYPFPVDGVPKCDFFKLLAADIQLFSLHSHQTLVTAESSDLLHKKAWHLCIMCK